MGSSGEQNPHSRSMLTLFLVGLFVAVSARPQLKEAAFFRPQIIGGENAAVGEFPHQLSMRYLGSHSCGAVVIRSDRALCAAHCVDGRDAFDLTLGYGTIQIDGGNEATVNSLLMHPDYVADGSQGFPNDISIFYTSDMSGPNVAPIARPSGNTDFGGDQCIITGWGDTTAGGGVLAQTLQKKTINILTHSECEGYWAQYDPNKHVCLWDPSDQAGSCQGDSGGPLQCNEGGKVVAGVTSWGVVGCQGMPSVYTRISNYNQWIDDNLN